MIRPNGAKILSFREYIDIFFITMEFVITNHICKMFFRK